MEPVKQWWIEERIKKAIENLKMHGFNAIYVKTKEEAVEKIWEHITPDMKIGVGGSLTVRAIGILDRLEAQGNTIYNHLVQGLPKEKALSMRKLQMSSDLFFTSVNAITMNGELVSIDGVGNRVNASVFGPGKVIIIAGYNKIVEDIQEAIKRIKNVVAPQNAKRLNFDVPCTKLGKCVDCNSPQRICRVIVIQERKPALTEMLIILVGEELGL